VLQFGQELAEAFGYWVGAIALLGLWHLRHRPASAADRFVQVFLAVFSLAVVRFAAREGYVDARHLMPMVVAGIGSAGVGLMAIGARLSSMAGRHCHGLEAQDQRGGTNLTWSPAAITITVLAGTLCLIGTWVPAHGTRLGHRRAAGWLALAARPAEAVVDTRGWTGLYSGRRTYRFEDGEAGFSDPLLAYVVLEGRELRTASARSRTLRALLGAAAEPVATFHHDDDPRSRHRSVLVYRWHPERFARWAADSLESPGGEPERDARALADLRPKRRRGL
jgi:hypothetical protein